MATTIAIAVVPLLAARALYTGEGISRSAFLTELALPFLYLMVLLTIVLVIARIGVLGGLDISWWRRGRAEGLYTLLLVLVALLAYFFLAWLMHRLDLEVLPNTYYWADRQGLGFYVAVTIVSVVLTPPAEELFWRGYIQRTLSRIVGGFASLLGQSLLFGMIHMRPFGGFVPVFVLGLIAGTWRWRRKTLVPIILAHMVINLVCYTARWPRWLEFMRVRPTIDYIGEMSLLAMPADYDPNLDARLDYEKALELLVQTPRELNAVRGGYPADWSDKVRDAAYQWIAANQQALAHVAQGATKAYYWPAYRDRDAILVPESGELRTLALALGTRVKLRAFEGKPEEMSGDIVALYRFGGHFCGTRALIHQYVGLWIRRTTLSILRDVLAREPPSPDVLASIQDRFEQFADSNDALIDFSLQRLTCLDDIQRLFTDEGNGAGHIPKGAFRRNALPRDQEQALLRLGRRETTAAVERFFQIIQNARNMTPWQLHRRPHIQLALENLVRSNAYLEWRVGTLAPMMEEPWRNQTYLEAMIVLLAAIRYSADYGQYPNSLEQLVEIGYLEHVPQDPYSDGPVIYRRVGDDFLLYSCGADFDDDGGVPSKWGEGKNGGDQVFWAVSDTE